MFSHTCAKLSAVCDYTREDFTVKNEIYDVIFDTVNKLSITDSLKCLHNKGTLILGASLLNETFHGMWIAMTGSRKVLYGPISDKAEYIYIF